MEITAVKDRESLRAYLETLEGDAAVLTMRRVAFRAASRLFPLALRFFMSEDAAGRGLTPAPIFGALAVGGAATGSVGLRIGFGSKAAYEAARSAELSGYSSTDTYGAEDAGVAVADGAASYATMVVVKVALAAGETAAGSAANAVHAAARPVDAGDASAGLLPYLQRDLKWFEEDFTGDLPSLWQNAAEPDPLSAAWKDAKARMEADTTADWSFWILWYERVRAGRDFHADKLAEIINPLRGGDWNKGPAHINPKFDDLLALYREEDLNIAVAATPMGEVVEYVPARDVLVLRSQDQVSESYLDDVREQIASAVRIFSGDEDHNLSGSLRRELRILEDAQTRHAKRPVIILQDVRRVLDRMDHKERSEGLPSAEVDADIADFRDILSRVQLDLIALSPEVKNYHEATKPAATADECALLARAAEVAKEAGDEELAAILQETADALKDPSATPADRRSMFYAAASRLSRMWKVARSGLKDSVSLGKDVVFATTILKWFSDQPVVKEAIELIVEIFVKP